MISIVKRPLKEREIDLLMSDIRSYPSLIYVKKARLIKYREPYVVEDEGEFVGMCAAYEFDNWVKLGPFVFLKKFHGKGYGKILLTKIVGDYVKKDIYITSSNIAVQKIIEKLDFKEIGGLFDLPLSVKMFLLRQMYEHIHWKMITEFIRKKMTMKSSARKYYIKHAQ
jgi:RimJ/RimL family protein N-acetyltransferase